MATTLAKLNAKAEVMYNNQIDFSELSLMELVKLWYEYCVYGKDENGKMTGGAAYDDEVYDALDGHGFWDWV